MVSGIGLPCAARVTGRVCVPAFAGRVVGCLAAGLLALPVPLSCARALQAQTLPTDGQQEPRLPTAGEDSSDTSPGDTTPRLVRGRVVKPGEHDVVPVAGTWVTLHRVGPDTAGPLDSVRTGRDGAFTFTYRPSGSDRAVYFVSATRGGIAYISPPLRGPRVTGEDAEIAVFDTTSRPVPLQVRGRHVIIAAPSAQQTRAVVEVYDLSNDTSLTAVAGEGGSAHPTWSASLPRGATDAQVGQSDVPADAISFERDRALVYAPFAPGLKQVSFAYSVPATAFPLTIPIERATSVLEVLLEDRRGTARGTGLREVTPVSVEGRNFRRFVAQDPPAKSAVQIDLPPAEAAPRRVLYLPSILIAVMVVMLLGAARAAFKPRLSTTVRRLGPH